MDHQSIREPHPASAAGFQFLRTPDGLRLRYGHWAVPDTKCRGTVLVLAGRAEFMEKYLESIQDLNRRGFDVFSFDWRGQGLSGRLLDDPGKGYIQSYDHYLTDLQVMLRQVVLPQRRGSLIILAHSMGAHIALRYLDQYADEIDKAVLSAPMINIRTAPIPAALVRWISRRMTRSGLDSITITGSRYYNPFCRRFANNRLTSDPVRFDRMQQTVVDNPYLATGSVTYGWLAATFESIDRLRQPGFGTNIKTAVLMITAGNDRIVCNRASLHLARQLPCCQMETIGGARHEILQERDALRHLFWQLFDRFVAVGCRCKA